MDDTAAAAARPFRNINNFSGVLWLVACVFLFTTVVKRNNIGVWIDNLYHIKPGKYHGVGTPL